MLILNTRKAGNVILSATEVGKNGATKIFGGKPGQKFAHATIGHKLPPWLDEGLAEYFGEAIFTGDGYVDGAIPPWRAKRGMPG